MLFCRAFDDVVEQYNVYKVETIADGYVVSGGLPRRIGDKHATEVAAMALHMMAVSVNYCLPGCDRALPLRIGINSGIICIPSSPSY